MPVYNSLMAERENFRFRLDPEKKRRWVEMCDRKNVGQQDAIESILGWVLAQDDLTQSMLLGQIAATDDLLEMVLRRLLGNPQAKFTGRGVPSAAERVGSTLPTVHPDKPEDVGRRGRSKS